MTDPAGAGQPWDGPTGQIGPDLVRSIIARPATHVFYVAGPPAMVTDMQHLLNRLGILDDNVRSETFSGY
jgi:ferredoxin-NADP reductase